MPVPLHPGAERYYREVGLIDSELRDAGRRREAEVPVEGLPPGFGGGLAGRAAFGIALAFSAFQLWVAAFGSLPSQVVRAMHVGFLLLLGFALIGNLRAATAAGRAWFWTLGLLGFATGRLQLGVLCRPDPAEPAFRRRPTSRSARC